MSSNPAAGDRPPAATTQRLLDAHRKAERLLHEIERRGYIAPGQTESELSEKIHRTAGEVLGVERYWHKRVVRAGRNTLEPYREFPPDRVIAPDDILFLDLGPVFEAWEADIGRTYVLGDDAAKLKLQADVVAAWREGREFFRANFETLTGASFFAHTCSLAKRMGWEYGGPHCGHLVGRFPHERLLGNQVSNYLHPQNPDRLGDADKTGPAREWVYEIHFVDREREIGGFFEQWLGVE